MKKSGDPVRLTVAVLMGGQSAERDVSLESSATVLRELEGRHVLIPVEILSSGRWRIRDDEPTHATEALSRLREERVDVVFNGLHGPLGEDGSIQGLFRILHFPLTGPDFIPAAVTMDKRLTKLTFQAAGIPTPRFFTEPSQVPRPCGTEGGDVAGEGGSVVDWGRVGRERAGEFPFPWVLKPNRLGSSVGVFLVPSAEALLEQGPNCEALCRGDEMLIEEKVEGRELSCPVVEFDGEPRALPVVELRPRRSSFFDYDAKYTAGATEELCPAPLTSVETAQVQETAVAVHRLLRCAPLSRTDLFLTPAGDVQVLEVNTLPGLTETSLVPLAAAEVKWPLRELLQNLLEHALERAVAQGYGSRSRLGSSRVTVEQL